MATLQQNIDEIKTKIDDAYNTLNEKGVDVSSYAHNLTNLPSLISSISGGGSSGDVSMGMDELGAFLVSKASESNVLKIVGDGSSIMNWNYQGKPSLSEWDEIEVSNITFGMSNNITLGVKKLTFKGITEIPANARLNFMQAGKREGENIEFELSFPDLTDVYSYGFMNQEHPKQAPTKISFPKLHYVRGNGMNTAFCRCTNLVGEISFPELQTVDASGMYQLCRYDDKITSVSMPKLEVLGQAALRFAFNGCTSLKSIDLSSVKTINGNQALDSVVSNSGVEEFHLDNLTTTNGKKDALGWCCQNCTSLHTATLNSLVTSNGENAMKGMFDNTGLTKLELPSLTSVNGKRCCDIVAANCPNLTSISFPLLVDIIGQYAISWAFGNDTSLVSVSFPSLRQFSGNYVAQGMFNNCQSLETVEFPSLKWINGGDFECQQMFQNCTSLRSVSFPVLESTNSSGNFSKAFNGCTSLKRIDFPSLTQVSGAYGLGEMLIGSSITEVHFRADAEAMIAGKPPYAIKFGAPNPDDVTIYFDL